MPAPVEIAGGCGVIVARYSVGAPLTSMMTTCVVVATPSVTLSEMLPTPDWPDVGVTVRMRDALVPETEMPDCGSSVLLFVTALTSRLSVDPSAAATANAIGCDCLPLVAFSRATLPIVGAACFLVSLRAVFVFEGATNGLAAKAVASRASSTSGVERTIASGRRGDMVVVLQKVRR